MTEWSTRDRVLFFAGLAGVAVLLAVWATTGREPPEGFLVLFGGMMGMPLFFRADERREDEKRKEGQ